jgi:FADH2 O2-dependent halogenase
MGPDVIIVGAGFAGSLLALVLARGGRRVLLVDREPHPRFAIGESTVPRTSLMLRLIAARFGVPEVVHLASPEGLRRHVASSCGIKRGFGFVHHAAGDVRTYAQTVVRAPENHYFRQDVDAHLFYLALGAGCEARLGEEVVSVEERAGGLRIVLSGGECLETPFLVDACGYRSPVADAFGLRDQPCRLRHRSRAAFTHMIGVRPFEECVGGSELDGLTYRLSQGTTHHLFDGGWMWVIPFDNQPGSTNPLCSVGLSLDPERFPARPAARDLADLGRRFPSIGRQLADAREVRPWVATGRLQYSSRRTVSERHCLLAHAAGFVDPLFSRGLAHSVDMVYALAIHLLEDAGRDAADLEALQQGLLTGNDELVHGAFLTFRDADLWRAWLGIWQEGAARDKGRLDGLLEAYGDRPERTSLASLDAIRTPGPMCPDDAHYDALFKRALDCVSEVDRGSRPVAEAAHELENLVAELRAA